MSDRIASKLGAAYQLDFAMRLLDERIEPAAGADLVRRLLRPEARRYVWHTPTLPAHR